MTEKEILIQNLKRYQYSYIEEGEKIIIKKKKLVVEVLISNPKIVVNSKLTGWNFITGSIPMDFEKVKNYILKIFISVFLMFLFLIILFVYQNKEISNLIIGYSVAATVVIFVLIAMIYLNYRIMIEKITDRIMYWLKY